MQVLQFLAKRPGEAVTRRDLEVGVWRDRVVGYEALGRTIAQLRKGLGRRLQTAAIHRDNPEDGLSSDRPSPPL